MDVPYVIIDTLAITLLLLIASSFVVSAPRSTIAWLIGLIAFSYICYLISARHDYAAFIPADLQIDFGPAYVVINLARNSVSALFMLLAHALFRENQRLPRIFIGLIALQLFLEEPLGWMLGTQWEQANPQWKFLLFEFVPACLQMTFTASAVYWAVVELKFDLVASRRAARVLLLILVAVQGLLSLVVERIGFTGEFVAYQFMYPIHMLLVLIQVIISAAVVFWLLRRDLLEFLVHRPPVDDDLAEKVDASARDVSRILEALEADRIYQQMGLTVADLARHVGIPEYRLRDLIHNQLGYRNFNSFLHHYRIAEVTRSLEDEKQNHTPILTLALAAGYQSINPFNRAFRELKNMTPSEYRGRMQR